MNEQEKFSPNADAEAVSAETKAPNELSPTAASDTLSADMPATEQTCENADNAAQPSHSIEASPSQPEINPEIKSEQCSEDNARSKSIEYKSVLDELRELAFAEAANIDYLPQPVTQLRRKVILFKDLYHFTDCIYNTVLHNGKSCFRQGLDKEHGK